MAQTIIALYDDLADARQAARALRDAGVEREQISLAAPDPEREYAARLDAEPVDEEDTVRGATADGALAGGALGGLAGLLFGLAAFAVPGIGPLLVAGPLWTATIGAGLGGLGGGLVGALVEAGVPEEEAAYYKEGIRRGHTLLAVTVADKTEAEKAGSLMQEYRPLDIGTQASTWQESGWEAPDDVPDRFIPATDDESDQHKYATGAMGEDMYGERATRTRPTLPTYDKDDTKD